jgi:multiple sugar transport system substrate-binding protein
MLAAAALLAGCGSRAPRIAPGVVTLEFFNYASPEFLELYDNKLIPAFEKSHPGIKIRTITDLGNTSYDAKLMTLMAGKIPPDLIHVTQQSFPFYAVKDAVLPLDPFIANDPRFRVADYYPEVMNELRYKGRQLGLPSDFSTIIFFYNQDLFHKYGVAPPRPGWTWYDFLGAARKLTRDTDGDRHTDVYGFSNPSAYNRWPAWVWMNGGDILSKDGTECVMDTPAAIGGMRFYVDLSLKEKVAPTPGQSLGQDFEDMFASQRVAMIADSRFAYKRFVKSRRLKFHWDTAPMPRGKEQATTFIWGANCILRSTKHPREAWEFLKFLSGPEAARINAASGNALPALKSAAEEAVLHPLPGTPKHDRYFLDAVAYGRTAPFPPQFAEYNAAMVGLQDAFLGIKPVDTACRDFTTEVNDLLHGEVF